MPVSGFWMSSFSFVSAGKNAFYRTKMSQYNVTKFNVSNSSKEDSNQLIHELVEGLSGGGENMTKHLILQKNNSARTIQKQPHFIKILFLSVFVSSLYYKCARAEFLQE